MLLKRIISFNISFDLIIGHLSFCLYAGILYILYIVRVGLG